MTWFWLLIASGTIFISSSFANLEVAFMYLEQVEWANTAPITIPATIEDWEIERLEVGDNWVIVTRKVK